MKLQTSILTAAAALLLATGANAQTLVFQDIGTGAPTPGALDISQLSTAGTGADGQLNYYWDNGHQHTNAGAGNGYPGETFTTGANAAGYYITSLALKTDGNGGDTPTQPESFTLTIYQITGTGNTNAALLASYVASGTLAAEGDWIQLDLGYLSGTPLKLAANTTYAYGFGITPGSPESWERLASATGSAFAGQICLVNVGGGTVTYSTNTADSVGTFDLGLVSAATPPPSIPPSWTTNSLATLVTNQILWNYWGPGLTSGTGPAGGNGFGNIIPVFDGLGDTLYGTPETLFTNILEGPAIGAIDNYVDQFIGVFIPPVTTNYNFFICSDDYSQLYLSTDITAAHAQLIAEENQWSNEDQWTTSGGGSTLGEKRSDQFIGGNGAPQYPNGVPLVAGFSYFIELVHEQGGGGANDEATYSFAGAATPVNGATTLISGNELGYVQQPPSFVSFVKQPANTTAYVGGEAAFSVVVNSDATPYVPAYQWQTNGVNVTNADGTAASGSLFTYIASASDTGTKVQCLVTYPGANSNTYTSASATLTVVPGIVTTGALKREFWFNAPSLGTITSDNLPAPSVIAAQTNGTGPTGTGIVNYVERYSGWFTPSASGNYTFFVESDDNSDLFISTDGTPDNKYLIAQETTWANPNEWLTDNGGAITAGTTISQKNSSTFLPPGQTTAPYGNGIALVAGKNYYIEADHSQVGGGDSFGMTFVLQSDIAGLTNYAPSAFGGTNISFSIGSVATNLSISQQPVAQTVFEGGSTFFQAAVSTGSQIQPTYEWLINGTNLGGGSFTNLFTTLQLANIPQSDNGATVEVIVSIPFTSLSVTSTPVKLTVNQAVTVPGFLKMQFFGNGISSDSVIQTYISGALGNPEYTTALPTFLTSVNDGLSQYLQVVNGFFIPPETGDYVFNTCSDDQGELLLSTDDSAANLRLIAQVTSWDNAYQYVSSAGGSSIPQKESDTWSPNPTAANPLFPYAGGIHLLAGSNYFIEELHYEGGGGDNSSVVFWTEDGNYPLPADGSLPDFAPTNIAMLAPAATLAFSSEPASVTVLSGGGATFTAAGTTTSQITVGEDTPAANPSYLAYQWYYNGVAIAGATGSSYGTGLLAPTNSGDHVSVAISAIGAGISNSTVATITVTADTGAPTLESAYYVLDSGGTGSESTNSYVDVTFSKAMSLDALLNPANYTIAGATITGVTLFTNGYAGTNSYTQAILQLAQPLKGAFTLTVSGMQSFSGVPTSNTSVAGGSDPLTSEDIALGGIQVPGTTIYNGPGSYTVNAAGLDIWNSQDSFRFVYTTRTNNFDIEVEVSAIDPADTWTKAGLMARETIDPLDGGSRMISVESTASTTTSPKPADGSTAENSMSVGWRSVTDSAAFNGNVNTPGEKYSYIGDGNLVPVYPNDAWIRLTRTGYGTTNDMFTGYGSTNGGLDWVLMCTFNPESTTNNVVDAGDPNPTNAPFPSVVYVGMCTTAHTTVTQTFLGTAYYNNFGDTQIVNPPPSSPILTAKLASPTTVSVSWTPGGGTLYQSTTLSTNSSSWSVVGTSNPATITIAPGAQFFEVRQ